MLHTFTRFFLSACILTSMTQMIACKSRMLPKSSLDDNSENREIMKWMDSYIKGMQERSVEQVMALVAPDYHETNATSEPEDDYDYNGLQTRLEDAFSRTKELRLQIYLQKIIPSGNTYEIYYFFKQHALVDFPSGTKWMSASDVNRLVARKKGKKLSDGLEIISGL